ncbi:unnamed protein product [Thelazia callipaeda]|uniref:Non-specific serine/threonine protein kinase n=1 Tax=Thelazia callipaeda TaxID=103827 RepID=A0A0N5D479_THECL|nr:unnamed protein product [Thelazia callipaeda]
MLIKVAVTCQDRLKAIETEKTRKYYQLANKLGSEMRCRTKILLYMIDLGLDCNELPQMLCEGDYYIRPRRGIHPTESAQEDTRMHLTQSRVGFHEDEGKEVSTTNLSRNKYSRSVRI